MNIKDKIMNNFVKTSHGQKDNSSETRNEETNAEAKTYIIDNADFDYLELCAALSDEAFSWVLDQIYDKMHDSMYVYLKKEEIRRVDLAEWLWRARCREQRKKNYLDYYVSLLIGNTKKNLPNPQKEKDSSQESKSIKLYNKLNWIKENVLAKNGTFENICDAMLICVDFFRSDESEFWGLSYSMDKDDNAFRLLIEKSANYAWFYILSVVIAAHILSNTGEL